MNTSTARTDITVSVWAWGQISQFIIALGPDSRIVFWLSLRGGYQIKKLFIRKYARNQE